MSTTVMDSIKWFEGSTHEAMREISKRNCVFLVYIGQENDDFKEVFKDPTVIQFLNSELVLCFNLDPASESFHNFKEIFNNVSVPSIYFLERSNSQKYIVRSGPLLDTTVDVHSYLKRRILDAIQSIVKTFANLSKNDDDKQKCLTFLKDINAELQVIINPTQCDDEEKVTEVKKHLDTAKIKIKIPSIEVEVVQEFPSTSTLNDVKTFVLGNYSLPSGSLKCIAHRQFVDEDYSKTLDVLQLCPSSTIYFHIMPSFAMSSYQSWFSVFFSAIVKPFNYIAYFVTSFFRPPPIEYPRQLLNDDTEKKPAKKSASNIHQLKSINPDDNDENNTYNGNSTQQM